MIEVNYKSFFDRYTTEEYHHGIFIPEDVILKYFGGLVHPKTIKIRDTIYEEIEQNKRSYEDREDDYQAVSELRLSGMAFDKQNDFDNAISAYKESIAKGEASRFDLFHAYAYSYERIIIILHKAKRYKEEAHYIACYMNYNIGSHKIEKYTNRLIKLKSKYGLQQNDY